MTDLVESEVKRSDKDVLVEGTCLVYQNPYSVEEHGGGERRGREKLVFQDRLIKWTNILRVMKAKLLTVREVENMEKQNVGIEGIGVNSIFFITLR